MTDKKLTSPTLSVDDDNKDKKFSHIVCLIGDVPIKEVDNDEFKQIKSDIDEINEAERLKLPERAIIVLTYYLYYKNYKKCDVLAEYYERQAQKEKDIGLQRLQKDLQNQEIDHYQELYSMTGNPVYLKLMKHAAKEKKDE